MPSSLSQSCSGRGSPVSLRSFQSGSSANSSPARRRDGPSAVAGPSGCLAACAPLVPRTGSSPARPPRPEEALSEVFEQAFPEDAVAPLPTLPPSPPQLRLARLSTTTTLNRHLSTTSPSVVLPFSSKRRPSIPLEDFPTSPTDEEWEDFSFEEDIAPVSPTRRNTLRRKPSIPHSPRLVKGASLARSHASRRSRRNRFTTMNVRSPTSPTNNFSHIPSVYSTYSYYDPAQLDAALDDQSEIVSFDDEPEKPLPSRPEPESEAEQETEAEVVDASEVPGGSNLDPRGSVSSVSTVRPLIGQRNQSRLGGLKEKFRWLPGRSGSGQDSSSDESVRGRSSLDSSSIEGVDATSSRPSYTRACTTSYAAVKQSVTGKSVVFTKPGFKSLRGTKQGSSDFQLGHGYQSSTDSSSYASSFSSFEKNLRIGGTAGSMSSCGDDLHPEGSPTSPPRPLSASRASSIIVPVEEPKNITGPPVPSHVRSRSHNFQYPRPRTIKSFETLRQPTLRERNNVPHHPFPASVVPYPLAYSPAMMSADRWNHALLFGDERNPANAGGLLRGSTVSFSQFYGVGSGRKEVLKGKELRGGKVLDLGCGEGLWILSAAKEWKYTRFVGFDLMPVQMNLHERLQGVKNASDIIDRIEWINGDCLNAPLPFDDNSFDLIRLANMTLALPTDPESDNWRLRALFSEIFRVLKVDGELEVIDENHVVPSASVASPGNPENAAFNPAAGVQCNQLEKAFENMLTYNRLSAYPVIPDLLKQHFSTSSQKAHFRLAVSPDANTVSRLARRDGMSEETAARVEIDRDLGLVEDTTSVRGRSRSGSIASTRNRKMLQLLGKEFAESRKSTSPTGLIVLPNKILPMSPAAVYAHATHSTNVILAAKEQLFDFVELCARGRGVADRQEFEDLLWQYESSRFDRLGLRDPLQTFNDWSTGVSDSNEGLWSNELRSPKASSPPPDAQPRGVGSMGPLPNWRYESDSDVVTVREIRVCLARKTSVDAPAYNPQSYLQVRA
ncbi:methyltransferase domain protein [Ceratobasidium sp. AG-Ba]|nr:methyltransferase domain protein [Ceratobasidium sp. AG-Ba]QRV98857.1 methyltransferase domain protein [Ceratobasidium sp. AG-Ba]